MPKSQKTDYENLPDDLKSQARPQEWLKALQENPGAFANLEKEIHHAFEQMADRVVAGLLAQATAPAEFAEAAKKK